MHAYFFYACWAWDPTQFYFFLIFLGLGLTQLIQPVQPSHWPKLVTRLGHTPTKKQETSEL